MSESISLGWQTRVVEPDTLIPSVWLADESVAQIHVYNPALTFFRGRRLMAYRLDSGRRTTLRRRIGLCELDESWQVVAGSALPLSDFIREGGDLHYDPRFLVYQKRLFVHYNNNYRTRPNQIFLVEIDPDTLEARSSARPIVLDGPRQEIEKNWMFFEHEGDLFAVYQISPHTILRVELDAPGPVHCRRMFETAWDVSPYAARYGLPCGGAPPVRRGDEYVSFFHSHRQVSPLRWLRPLFSGRLVNSLPRYPAAAVRRIRWLCIQRRYYGGVYAFAATPPFAPCWLSSEPVLRPEVELPRQRPRWIDPTSEKAVYPAGAVLLGDDSWLVSYGVHEERCALRLLANRDLCGPTCAGLTGHRQ